MNDLAITVVIPTYNRANLIGRALRSVLAAIDRCSDLPGGGEDEVIVIDDGSTDETPQRVAEFTPRVRYVSAPHTGAGPARNRGVAEAKRPLIAFLDSDDEWIADKLHLQRQVMARWPELVMCCSDFGARMKDGSEHPNWLRQWTHDQRPWREVFGPAVAFSSVGTLPARRADFSVHIGSIYRAMLDAPYVSTDTLLVRRSVAGEALRFPDLPCYEDWECFARLSSAGQVAFLDTMTSWQWEHPGPRLTDAFLYERAPCRLSMIQNVWGRDQQFLSEHKASYRRALAQQHMLLGRRALVEGRQQEAKIEFAKSGFGVQAQLYRALASLPMPVLRSIQAVRHMVRLAG